MLSVCPHDCPSCCSLVVTVADGRLTSVTGNPDHPFTRGVICGKVREYAERVHSPLRVRRPLRRVGPKGAGEFAPISWDEAIGTIADRWRAIIAADGAESILPFSYAGSMGQIQYFAGHPLFHALGASQLDRSICVSTAYAGWRMTVGAVTGNDSEQMVGADLVVLWGINAAYSTINVMTLVKQARARGAYFVVIDPYRTATAQQADEHLMVKPGSDGALALAMMHVLVREDLLDRDYLARATLGFDQLAEHVRAGGCGVRVLADLDLVGHAGLGQVPGEHGCFARDLAGGLLGDLAVEVVDQNLGALAHEQLGGRAPDAARRARDDRRLAVEYSHSRSVSLSLMCAEVIRALRDVGARWAVRSR